MKRVFFKKKTLRKHTMQRLRERTLVFRIDFWRDFREFQQNFHEFVKSFFFLQINKNNNTGLF